MLCHSEVDRKFAGKAASEQQAITPQHAAAAALTAVADPSCPEVTGPGPGGHIHSSACYENGVDYSRQEQEIQHLADPFGGCAAAKAFRDASSAPATDIPSPKPQASPDSPAVASFFQRTGGRDDAPRTLRVGRMNPKNITRPALTDGHASNSRNS